MAVKIGSARINERGTIHGGRPGDQTGTEVSTQDYYVHTKGWRVFRLKDSVKAEMIADNMQAACDNKHIGYDQAKRSNLFSKARPFKFDCSKVASPTNTDCSALVRVCCHYAGISVPDFNTESEAKVLLDSGYFDELKDKKYTSGSDYLLRGDVLVTKTKGHTVVVLSNGTNANEADVEIMAVSYICVRHGHYYVRKTPDKNGAPVCVVNDGDKIPYLDESKNGWNKVRVAGEIGWLSQKAGDIYGGPVDFYTVKKGNWRVREAIGAKSKSVGVVKGGDVLMSLGFDCDGWLQVEYKGQECWISKKAVVTTSSD